MSSLSIAKSRNLKTATPKKGSAKSNTSSRRKVPSTAATAKKPPAGPKTRRTKRRPPREVSGRLWLGLTRT
jgi:hypothetical protein